MTTDNEFGSFHTKEALEISSQIESSFGQDNKNATDFKLLSSVRYDSNLVPIDEGVKNKEGKINEKSFFLVDLHWRRLQTAIKFFGWPIELPFDHFMNELRNAVEGLNLDAPYKLRVSIAKSGEMVVESTQVVPRENLFSGLTQDPPQYNIYIDTKYTIVGPFTSFKTTRRELYEAARDRNLPKNTNAFQEVVLFNSKDEVTEGSLTNVAFLRDGKWITPSVTSGCLSGVVRHYLLQNKHIEEGTISVASIAPGDKVLIFNGVIGVCSGVVVDKN